MQFVNKVVVIPLGAVGNKAGHLSQYKSIYNRDLNMHENVNVMAVLAESFLVFRRSFSFTYKNN